MNDPLEQIMEERNKQYADAWSKTGEILEEMPAGGSSLLLDYPQAYFPWIMILNKWIRILTSPKNSDHWLDIAGYAMLVHKDLTDGE